MGRKYISFKDIANMGGFHVSTARRYAKRADFPEPFRFGARLSFDEPEVLAWFESRRLRRGRA